jgi:signal transduction histidine kinase
VNLFRLWLVLAVVLALLPGLVPARAFAAPGAADAILRIETAQAELRPDGAEARTMAVTLPHRWDKVFGGRAGEATYTLMLPPGHPQRPMALLIERVGNQARVRAGGVTLAEIGGPDDRRTDSARRGLAIPLPPGLPHAEGGTLLVIDVTMQALRAGGLSAVRIGPVAQIDALEARLALWGPGAAAGYAASLLLMGGLALGLWWRQRDPVYGCFGLAALFGTLRHLDKVLPEALLPWPWWGALLAIGYACHLALIARFVLLLLGPPPAWLDRATAATLAAVVLLAGTSFATLQPGWWTAALVILEIVGLGCFALVLRRALVDGQAIAWLVLAAGSLLLAAGAHDLLLVRMALFGGSSFPLTSHAMFVLVLILAGLVVSRYSQSVDDYRALTERLAQRIAERESQLHEAFTALREQQQEQAVQGERQRMMREIHDGIGAQLVGLLGMVGQPGVERAVLQDQVKQALDEMRMAVDALQPVHDDLTTVLATLRYRLQPRLAAAGIEVVWDVEALPPMPGLSPQAILQLQRILLEAITNVLKHAQATRVTVAATPRGGGAVSLRLTDNGVGLGEAQGAAPGTSPGGFGIANMHARAAAIGASLRVARTEAGGTCVAIDWAPA